MISFKQYMSQPHIQLEMMNLTNEATLKFGKFSGGDVNDSKYDWLWSGWLSKAMEETPEWTPRIEDDDGSLMSRDKIFRLIQSRNSGEEYQSSDPQPQEDRKAVWVLAKTKIQLGAIPPGVHVVMTKMPNNNWNMMDRNAKTKEIPEGQ